MSRYWVLCVAFAAFYSIGDFAWSLDRLDGQFILAEPDSHAERTRLFVDDLDCPGPIARFLVYDADAEVIWSPDDVGEWDSGLASLLANSTDQCQSDLPARQIKKRLNVDLSEFSGPVVLYFDVPGDSPDDSGWGPILEERQKALKALAEFDPEKADIVVVRPPMPKSH